MVTSGLNCVWNRVYPSDRLVLCLAPVIGSGPLQKGQTSAQLADPRHGVGSLD